MTIYPVFEITPDLRRAGKLDRREFQGLLTKFWVNHPQLGKSLVKLDRPYGKNWTEKVAYEIGKLMQLPMARYELAVLSETFESNANAPGIITINYKQEGLSYQESEAVIFQQLGHYPYNFNEETNFIAENNIELPPNYEPPDNINDGLDLWTGQIIFDGLIANQDRHGKNWEIGVDSNGNKSLAPLFDNGMSFGMTIAGRLANEPDLTPQKYMTTQTSYFNEYHRDLVGKMMKLRPSAAVTWLRQANKLTPDTIDEIINSVPDSHITPIEREFAKDLVKYNRQDFLRLAQKNLYESYSQEVREIGLAGSQKMAMNALSEGMDREIVTEMMKNHDPEYRKLAERGQGKMAEKAVITQAQVKLRMSQKSLSRQQFPNQEKSNELDFKESNPDFW
ncbi:MAG: hypothetical protein QNJ60_00325 [Xenococcaceae cyanobacterium MO_188.B19]|nr:hypothetical protein [Xenococcaceae cyanobacterium MO_188.B19]